MPSADHTPPPRRLGGVLCPVFALRRSGDLGIGDTTALRGLVDWAADTGVGFIQLLPVNLTHDGDPSPYHATGSASLDPLLLDLHPDVCPEVPVQTYADVAPGPAGARVDYPAVRRAKERLLEDGFARFWAGETAPARRRDFDAFRASERGWLEDEALFRLASTRAGTASWTGWPGGWDTPAKLRRWLESERERDREGTERGLAYPMWVQWLAARQWESVRAHADARGVLLMGDMPIGVNVESSDVFFHRAQFDLDWFGGAPPERVFMDDPFAVRWGQNWGVPLCRWDVMESDGFAWWRRRIGHLTRYFRLFRIDHVLGFYRIFAFPWPPSQNAEFLSMGEDDARRRTGGRLPRFLPHPDDTPAHRAANLAAGDRYLRALLPAAAPSVVVGEDLGEVPPYVRPHLLGLGVPGFRIPQWERDDAGRGVPGSGFDECSFATYATHDHPPVPALWETLRDRGDDEFDRLRQFAGIRGAPRYGAGVRAKLFSALFNSRSRYAALMITDLLDLPDRINTPSTVGPHNWSFRLPFDISALAMHPASAELEAALRASGRAPATRGPSHA